ncbi:MAG: hypothetical protein ACT452_02510 [Microthrixaceae bacterium]
MADYPGGICPVCGDWVTECDYEDPRDDGGCWACSGNARTRTYLQQFYDLPDDWIPGD